MSGVVLNLKLCLKNSWSNLKALKKYRDPLQENMSLCELPVACSERKGHISRQPLPKNPLKKSNFQMILIPKTNHSSTVQRNRRMLKELSSSLKKKMIKYKFKYHQRHIKPGLMA